MILFSAGLHFTFHDLRNAEYKSATVGVAGVLVPLLSCYFLSTAMGLDWTVAALVGATISATSIVIVVTILEEIRKEKIKEWNILVNAAVLDDV